MKKATLKESEATYDDKLAMIMAVGDATIEEASRALDECDDDIDGALALVYDQAPPPSTGTASSSSSLHNAPYKLARKGRHMEDADDETIAKPRESLMGAASNAARRQPFVAAAAAPKDPKDNVFLASHQPTTISPTTLDSANQNASYGNQTTTNVITPPQGSLLHVPGAFAIGGLNDVVGGHSGYRENQNDSTFSLMTTTVESGHGNADSEDLISAQLVGDIPQAEIVEEKQQCSTRFKIWSGVAVVLLVTVAVVLGTVLTQVLNAPTSTPSPQEILKELESVLIPVSFDNGTAIRTPPSPQNNALIWLANNTNLDSYSNATKIQRYALATLFFSTNGLSWNDNSVWMSDENECGWYNNGGSLCNSGSVETLSLESNYLFGTIPNELALLSNLNYLDLSSNRLAGTISSQLGLLTKLTELYLSGNTLTGTIPSQIALMSNLNTLHLSWNSLTGTIPSQIALMSNLNDLDLSANSLTGTIPNQIALMSNLTVLYLSGSIFLTGTIPSQIALMSNLTGLDLSGNSLMGMIPSQIGLLSNLNTLVLSWNSLMGMIPSQIGLLSNLNTLDLPWNSLTGMIPSQIGLLTKLTWLSLSSNGLTGTIPSQIALMLNLSALDLSVNSLTGMIPSELGLLSKLSFLDLSNNNFTGEFTCPAFIDYCRISCDDIENDTCRSL